MKKLFLTFLFSTLSLASVTIWESGEFGLWLSTDGFKLNDNKQYRSLSVDPTAGAGIAAPQGSLGARQNGSSGELWIKTGAADTAWNLVGTTSGVFTQGSVIFAGASGVLSEDNTNFFFDNTNDGLRINTTEALGANRKLNVGSNAADIEARIGQSLIGYAATAGFTIASFSHYLQNSLTGFALAQTGAGAVYLNAPAGQLLTFGNPFLPVFTMDVSGLVGTFEGGADLRLEGATSGYVQLSVPNTVTTYTMTLPAAVSTTDDVLKFDASATATFGKITNANVASGAAIAVNKLAALSASRIVSTDASGFLQSNASLTTNRLCYADGTGSIATDNDISIDTTNNRIGIGISTPASPLDVVGGSTSPSVKITSGATTPFLIQNSSPTVLFDVNSTGDATATGTMIATKAFNVSSGAAANPAYTFSLDPDTGWYSPGTNIAAVATGSTVRMTWNSSGTTVNSGQLIIPVGSSTSPSLSLSGDSDTGIAESSADNLVLITAGNTRLRTNSTGTTIGSNSSAIGRLYLVVNSAELYWNGNTVTTTDATPTTITTIGTSSNISYMVTTSCVGRNTTSNNTESYKFIGTFKNNAGTLTQIGTTTAIHTAEDDAAANCAFAISGTNIILQATGIAATTIRWDAWGEAVRN